MDSYRKTAAAYESGAVGAELCDVTVPGGRGKPDLTFKADEEYHNINFDKFTQLRTIFNVSRPVPLVLVAIGDEGEGLLYGRHR